MWKYRTPGIPDENFLRNVHVPITKEEIRVIQISKSQLRQGYIVYDVGCGSGSLTVEAALQIGKTGRVYSIDINSEAIKLTKQNIAKFGLTNVHTIDGNAKYMLDTLPNCDVIFIGGTGVDAVQIIEICYKKLKPNGKIIMGTILIETLSIALQTMKKLSMSVDLTQVIISKSRQISTGTMMSSRNPVTIISATKS
ncbi:MAG: precorrin-6Y C5,15-methyltransferase (decarboxylating) subunit CbiT [Thaumarchaeota archaeon]|nr:precorrin-6Y C5,15-methyltransferase (decarboxylating) subunit CbiT [Nitrososphaerota archaeon]MCY3975916.1 precorrin-6Y C5,15-methyltransferase (decarboxylating) subunit CbiT [Nitrososphaerota archaeon]